MDEKSKETIQKVEDFKGTIDDAIEYLIECRKKGESVYIDFHGHKLYSKDITIDGAYLQTAGMTKAELEGIMKEYEEAKDDNAKKKIVAEWQKIRRKHIEGEEKDTRQVRKVEDFKGTIDDAIEYLIKCRKKGELVYINFNGHNLYSKDITRNGAYLQVTGMTKSELEGIMKEYEEAEDEKTKEEIIKKWKEIREENIER